MVSEALKGVVMDQETCRIGDVTFDGRLIAIRKPNGASYVIEISRCQTAEDAFCWLCHLTEKSWFTPRMALDFIEMIKLATSANEYCRPKKQR